MATFMLIHGSWHGAWCWERVVPRLQEHGHTVAAIDLPGHGEDDTSFLRCSLGAYSRHIQATATALGDRPILVGHSMGGAAITQAALDAPDLFSALVYVCAFVPLPGETLAKLARLDLESLLPDSIRVCPTSLGLRPEKARQVFYAECSEEDAAWATERLRPDPWIPLIQRLDGRKPLALPRGYVECTKDRAITIARQRAMAGRIAFDRVATLETDHSPFLSAPDALAGQLHEMAQLAGRSAA